MAICRESRPRYAGRARATPKGPCYSEGPVLLRRDRVITEVPTLITRPYVLLSVAMSVDGHIDGTGPARLVLSGGADLDRVDAERAASDAVMVGAGTIRRDDPRLLDWKRVA